MRLHEQLRRAIGRRIHRVGQLSRIIDLLPPWHRQLDVSARVTAVFDAAFYRATQPDVARTGAAPLAHYLQHGWREYRDPSVAFDVSWYLETYHDVARAQVEPLAHYLQYGASEGRWPSGQFDPGYYCAQISGGLVDGLSPLEHYLWTGAALGFRTLRVEDDALRIGANADAALLGWTPSTDLLATAHRTLALHSASEPDLAALEGRLTELPILPRPTLHLDRLWRQLLQSLQRRPKIVVIVPAADDAEPAAFLTTLAEMASEMGVLADVLVLALDEAFPAVGDQLPDELNWLSFAELEAGGCGATRSALLLALLHATRPELVLCFGSPAGQAVLRRHHISFRSYMRIAVALPSAGPMPRAHGLLPGLAMADLLLVGAEPISDAERNALGLPVQEAGRILPLHAATQGSAFDRRSLRQVLAARAATPLLWTDRQS